MNKSTIAWLMLGGVGLYLMYRVARPAGGALAEALSLFDPFFGPTGPLAGDLGSIRQYTPAPGPGNEQLTQAKPSSPGTGAIGTAGAGLGSLAIGGTAAAIAGVTAGAALLAWGIVTQGWFRGGEEALQVNPKRDEILSAFAHLDPYRDSGNPPGFYGLAWLLNEIGAENGPHANIGRAYGDRLFNAMLAADTMDEFTPAVQNIVRYIQQYPQRVQYLENYAKANFSAAA